jgi:8-oxo-dGTP pyrophosphatase MutT (NUDIX family)
MSHAPQIVCTSLDGSPRLVAADALRFRPSVYALIVDAGELLVVNTRSTGRLFLPGGAIELGEPTLTALRREVEEETGIEIEVGRLLHWADSFFFYDPTGEAWHGLLLFFLCAARTRELSPDYQRDPHDEAEQPMWRAVSALRPEDFQEAARGAIERLQSLSGSVSDDSVAD